MRRLCFAFSVGYLCFFVKDHSDTNTKFSEVDVIKKLVSTVFTWSLADRYFSKQLAFQWAQTAPPYLQTYFFKGMRRRLYKVS